MPRAQPTCLIGVALVVVATLAAVASGSAHPELLRAIRCPVCDYTTSSLVKKVLAVHRRCQLDSGESKDDYACERVLEWLGWDENALPPLAKTYQYPKKVFSAQRKWVRNELLPSACSHHVFKAFPVGTSSPQSQQLAPGEEDPEGQGEYVSFEDRERARKEKIRSEYERIKQKPRSPVDAAYRAAIQESCELDFVNLPVDRKERMAHWLYNETLNAVFDEEVVNPDGGLDEVFIRRRDYQRVLRMQRYFCAKACGTINRPDGDEGPDTDPERGVLSWNADGEYISRNHVA